MNEKELLKKLKIVFIQEAKERLNSMSVNLISLEQNKNSPDSASLKQSVFRDAHSLKGAARSIGLTAIESVFQTVEDLLSEVTNNRMELSSDLFNILQNFISSIDIIIESPEIETPDNIAQLENANNIITEFLSSGNTSSEKPEEQITVIQSKEETEQKQPEKKTAPVPPSETKNITPKEPLKHVISEDKAKEIKVNSETETVTKTIDKFSSQSKETVRITSSKLDSLLLKSENMIRIKQIFYEHIPLIQKSLTGVEEIKQEFNTFSADIITLKQNAIDSLSTKQNKSISNLIKFCNNFKTEISEIEKSLKSLSNLEKENQRNTEKLINSFLYDVKDIAMLPFSNILYAFPRMVREIAVNLNKDIIFNIIGEEIKLDRRILQEIRDPLIHLIRNSIDHGIESAQQRINRGKDKNGVVNLSIIQKEGSLIEISISDNGKGIDQDVIKEKILELNIITPGELKLLSEENILNFIFHAGFSTKDIITDLSGRGLGMAIVKDKVESLGGNIVIESKVGKGTTIKLNIPVTLATFKGVLVESCDRTYVIPSNNIEEVIRVKIDSLKSVENRATVHYNHRTYPLVELSDIFGLQASKHIEHDELYITAAIIGKSNELMALKVDNIIEEQEILIKDLGGQLEKVDNITGATILNSGKVVPVLNVTDLLKSASKHSYKRIMDNIDSIKSSQTVKKNILIVEDSITSRILLKNIMESAGYKVYTAVDGIAGISALKSNPVDLVVSDVEMPRMDGFNLTSAIRADDKFKNLPVILVTARSAEEDRNKGIDAGANAYIVKSQFDQNNLLDTIKSLI